MNGQQPGPTLSIVIPAYNVAPYIRAAVESALDQDFADIEVVVVDDGSTDRTPDILAAIASERADPRLRIIRQDNAGLSGARNTGIAASRGALLGFLDGDDVWLREKAGRHVQAMQDDAGIGISFSHSVYVTDAGVRTGTLLLAGKAAPGLHDMIRRNHVGNGSSVVIRRAAIDQAGPFNAHLRACEDYELWCRILHATPYRAMLIPAPLTLYRMRRASLSYDHDKFVTQADAAMRLLRAAMPEVPDAVFNAGHAEHYRIAAWKAASSGQTLASFRLLRRAIRLRPGLLLHDKRAVITGLSLLLPAGLRVRLIGRKAAQSPHMHDTRDTPP
jgi:glycosyltransferase involved in cell wall biosynthesis